MKLLRMFFEDVVSGVVIWVGVVTSGEGSVGTAGGGAVGVVVVDSVTNTTLVGPGFDAWRF